jgi:hypothetical protein
VGNELKPGNMNPDDMVNSMAEQIDLEFDKLLQADGLQKLSFDMTDRMVRDRRRLFVAIARGVVQHLVANADAFSVLLVFPPVVVHPTIKSV